jgi:ABC-type thiamine transport system substrate-binding protein
MPVGADFDPRRKFPDIKAATLDRLVERLTHEKFPDPKFRNTLLLTYRSFTDSTCLMQKVEARFAEQGTCAVAWVPVPSV